MAADRSHRTLEDLQRAVRAIATEFGTDKVFIIGSQAVLVEWPDAPTDMTSTPEIDAYPGNAKLWQAMNSDMEASEHINALFGYGSQFHQTHGFYIDGVDEGTAKLPPGWEDRAWVRKLDIGGKTVSVVAPSAEDLIVSKLARLDPKDQEFIEAYNTGRPLDLTLIEDRVRASQWDASVADRAIMFIRALMQPGDKETT
jgi:hypothetical protein